MCTIQNLYTIVVLGEGGSGKTSLILQYIKGEFEKRYDPTLEDSFRCFKEVDGEPYTLDIIDTAGQKEYRELLNHSMQEGNGFLIVFSLDSIQSYESAVGDLFTSIKVNKKSSMNVPVVFVGNKCDLVAARKINPELPKRMAEERECLYVETSAKTNHQVKELFAHIVRMITEWNKASQLPHKKLLTKRVKFKSTHKWGLSSKEKDTALSDVTIRRKGRKKCMLY